MAYKIPTSILACFMTTVVIGCASSPKIHDISKCQYGQNESEIPEEVGIGSELVYFRLGENDYHYRSYVVGGRGTGPVYGLLFKNNKLSIIAKESSLSFSDCADLKQSENWESCFLASIRKMEAGRIDVATEDFSEGIAAEHAEIREDAIAYPLVIPVYVLFWPLTVLTEVARAPDYKAASECKAIPSTAIGLYPTATEARVIETLNDLSPNLVYKEQNLALDNRRVITRSWQCGQEQGTAVSPLRFSPGIEVRYGFDASTMNWLYIHLQPAWQKMAGLNQT